MGNDGAIMANYSDIKASGAVVTSYANYAALPSSGNSAGDLALTTDNGGLYVWDGSEWDRVASGADETPEFTTEPAASYELNSDGTPTVITVAATDPEGFPITYSHDTVPSNQAQATITNVGGTFTVTPSTTETDAGTFTLRLTASDGVNTTSKSTSLDLSFYSGLLQFSPSINGSSEWDSVSGASSVTLTDSSQEYTVTNPNSNAVVIQFDVQGGSGHLQSGSSAGTGGRAIATYSIPASGTIKLRVGAAAPGTGSGGGASAVYSSSDANTPYVVAGGGGGSGNTTGGSGGGTNGGGGTKVSGWNAYGGGGGSQTAGGAAGSGDRGSGQAGSFRQGGNGYYNSTNGPGGVGWAPGGIGGYKGGDGWQGGGGGGYYGGGGGGASAGGAGGGGGSGFIGNGATAVSNTNGAAEQAGGKIVMTAVP